MVAPDTLKKHTSRNRDSGYANNSACYSPRTRYPKSRKVGFSHAGVPTIRTRPRRAPGPVLPWVRVRDERDSLLGSSLGLGLGQHEQGLTVHLCKVHERSTTGVIFKTHPYPAGLGPGGVAVGLGGGKGADRDRAGAWLLALAGSGMPNNLRCLSRRQSKALSSCALW